MTTKVGISSRCQCGKRHQLFSKLQDIAKSEKAETITEVLVAMLIAGLAILMLATVIATAFNILNSSRKSMEQYYDTGNQLAAASTYAGTGAVTMAQGTITVKIKDSSSGAVSLDDGASGGSYTVTAYVGGTDSNNPVVSYESNSGSGGTP